MADIRELAQTDMSRALERIRLTIGVPLTVLAGPRSQSNAQAIADWLEGEHNWLADGEEYSVTVFDTQIKSQAAGALFFCHSSQTAHQKRPSPPQPPSPKISEGGENKRKLPLEYFGRRASGRGVRAVFFWCAVCSVWRFFTCLTKMGTSFIATQAWRVHKSSLVTAKKGSGYEFPLDDKACVPIGILSFGFLTMEAMAVQYQKNQSGELELVKQDRFTASKPVGIHRLLEIARPSHSYTLAKLDQQFRDGTLESVKQIGTLKGIIIICLGVGPTRDFRFIYNQSNVPKLI